MSLTHDEIYAKLLKAYGPQNWWPAETPFEVIVGAVLTQNAAWRNVERAIANLRDAGALSIEAIHRLSDEELGELIRPAGYFRLKARRLKNLIRFIVQEYDGSLEAMFAVDAAALREQLLSLNGIGPETADSILLYAAGKPVFVVDAYTARIFKRHGWIEFEAGYHDLQEHVESSLPADVAVYNEYHALLVRLGNQHCRKTPRCEECPLRECLPEGGPLTPETF